MIWESISTILQVAIAGWLTLVAGFILYKIVRGDIRLDTLLRHKDEQGFAFHRAQLLVVTLLFAIGYIGAALGQPPAKGLPDISTPLLGALLGSHVAYLGGKLIGQ